MITPEIAHLIRNNTLALVATVTPEGRPAVSPKATTVVLDERRIAFSDLRSPNTIRNIRANPAMELNFIDVFRRKAARVAGRATYAARGTGRFDGLLPQFSAWADLQPRMRGVVEIEVESAAMVLSPVYDLGADEAELADEWLARYGELIASGQLFASSPSS